MARRMTPFPISASGARYLPYPNDIRVVDKITLPEPTPQPVFTCDSCGERYDTAHKAVWCPCFMEAYTDVLD